MPEWVDLQMLKLYISSKSPIKERGELNYYLIRSIYQLYIQPSQYYLVQTLLWLLNLLKVIGSLITQNPTHNTTLMQIKKKKKKLRTTYLFSKFMFLILINK